MSEKTTQALCEMEQGLHGLCYTTQALCGTEQGLHGLCYTTQQRSCVAVALYGAM